MKISVTYGPLCLSARGSFDFSQLWTDPRGLTGSELGFVRIAQELKRLGHTVEIFTRAEQTEWEGMPVRPWEQIPDHEYDAAVAINEPDLLREAKANVRICPAWLNDFSFCRVGFENHVDLLCSPSESHREQVFANPSWRPVEVTTSDPGGKAQYEPRQEQWSVIPLGCDPERYAGFDKISGKVVYCSSPDRGLHLLLQEWPRIRRAVPHAELHVFYRLKEWLRGWDNQVYFPSIESQRARALYIDEALRRFTALGGIGMHVWDSVSRERIEREMATAEVLAYPCDPVNSYTEGFSCSTLEACAARACPVISDADALGSLYRDAAVVIHRGNWTEWGDAVIRGLTDAEWRESVNERAAAFAARHTWAMHAERLEAEIVKRLGNGPTVADLKREAEFMAEARLVGT